MEDGVGERLSLPNVSREVKLGGYGKNTLTELTFEIHNHCTAMFYILCPLSCMLFSERLEPRMNCEQPQF